MEEVIIGSKGLEDLKKIKAFLSTREVADLAEISAGTGITRETLSNRLNFFREKGELHRIAFNQWSLNPDAIPREMKSKRPYRKKDPNVVLLTECMNKMMRVGS